MEDVKMCSHCGSPMQGYAMQGDDWLCHPDQPAMDCYKLVTVYGHPLTHGVETCSGCTSKKRTCVDIDALLHFMRARHKDV